MKQPILLTKQIQAFIIFLFALMFFGAFVGWFVLGKIITLQNEPESAYCGKR